MHTIKRALAFSILFNVIVSMPVQQQQKEKCEDEETEESVDYEIIDQRQNGTENYRIHINGVLLMISPSESLFSATSLTDPEINNEQLSQKPQKPSIDGNLVDGILPAGNNSNDSLGNMNEKPILPAPGKPKGSRLRLPSYIIPFIRRHPGEKKVGN